MSEAHRRTLAQRAGGFAPIAVLVGLWFLFFWRVLAADPSARLTFQQGDFTLQFLAYRQMAFRQLREGRFPVFEECLYAGYPFQADPQSQMLYPPVLGIMLLGRALGWETYPLAALEWEAALHVLWAALGMYAFLWRGLALHRLAALFGALAFGFSGFITGYPILQTGILETAAWLPWMLLVVRRMVQAQRWVPYAVAAAWILAFAFAAGHPQTFVLVLYASIFAFLAWGYRALDWRLLAMRGVVIGALAAGISAAQLLPTFAYMLASTRASLSFVESTGGFVLRDLALLVLTGVLNAFGQPLYVGIITLVLAALAVALRLRQVWMWLVLALVALAFSFGSNAFAFEVAYWLVPGYRLFRSQERHAFLFVFAASALGAMGLDALLAPLLVRVRALLQAWASQLWSWATGVFVVFLAVLFAVQGKLLDAQTLPGFENRLMLLVIGIAGATVLLRWRADLGKTARAVWGSAAIALLVFDVFTANRDVVTQPYADPFPSSPLLKPVLELVQASPARGFVPRVYNHYGLPLNYACVFGANEVGGGSPIALAHYKAYLERAPEGVMIRQLNVRYAVTWRGAMQTREGEMLPWFLLARAQMPQGEASTYRLDWQPLDFEGVWVANEVRPAASADAIFEAMHAPGYDPFRIAFIFEHDLPHVRAALGATTLRGRGSAAVEGHAPGYAKIAVNVDAPALLVLSKAYHWNWVALVDGREVRPIPVNVGLLGVPIPAGARSIELSYRPLDFHIGLGISALSVLTSVILLFSAIFARRSRYGSSTTGGFGGASATM